MTDLLSFRFSGDLFYQDETLLTFRPGITLLRGINHDAGPSENNSNGTGKTRLPQLLSAFAFNDSDRGGLKQMVLPHFKGYLEFSKPSEKWSFGADVAEKEWDILRNGVVPQDKDGNPLSMHKFTDCQKFLAEQLKFSFKEWKNFVHINRHSISTLLQGSPDERRKFLESFFNIDDFYKEKLEEYKALKSAQEKEIEKLEQDRARYGQVLESLSTLEGRAYLTIQIETAKDSIAYLNAEHTLLAGKIASLKTDLSYWRDYYDYKQRAEGKLPLSVLRSNLQSAQTTLGTLQEQERQQTTVRMKAGLFESLQHVVEPTLPDVADPSHEDVLQAAHQLQQMKDKQKLRDKYLFVKKQIPVIDTSLTKTELQEELQKLFERQADINLHKSLVKDGKNCSRCGQSIDFVLKQEDPQVRHQALIAEGHRVAERMQNIQNLVAQIDQKKSLMEQLDAIKLEAEKLPVFTITMEEAFLQVESLHTNRKLWHTYRDLKKDYDAKVQSRDIMKAELTALGYPGILKEDYKSKRLEVVSYIDTIQDDIDVMQKAATLLDRVVSLSPQTELQRELQESQDEFQDLTDRVQKLNELHGEYKTQLAVANELHKAKEELEEKLKRSEHLYDEYRILQAMVKFFSPAGFKNYELRKRCELLIEKANHWSPIFFSEQYEWLLPDDNKLEFLVQPIAHRKTKPYPAADLSAGEENRAERVLLFSQLELAPKTRSLNALFLDEIEGHLDSIGRTVFTEIVLPKLKERFPEKSIILISHEESLRDSPHIDHLWLAERRGRKTTLKTFEHYNRAA